MKKSKLIKEMTIEEFLKEYSNVNVYEHRRRWFNSITHEEVKEEETGEWITDSQGGLHWIAFSGFYSQVLWIPIKLIDKVQEAIFISERDNFPNRNIVVALHTEPSDEDVAEFLRNELEKSPNMADKINAKKMLLFDYCYLDKWLTRQGGQTYLIGCNIDHLYVGRRKFYTKDDYFEFKKNETKEVIMIKY